MSDRFYSHHVALPYANQTMYWSLVLPNVFAFKNNVLTLHIAMLIILQNSLLFSPDESFKTKYAGK